jgi:branched-chain amino acid transport system substrate-binding protein
VKIRLNAALAGAAVAQAAKIPMITPPGMSPKITEVGDYIFCAWFIDPFKGKVIAKFAYNILKYRTAAILRDAGSEYFIGHADYFAQTFTELGGKIVSDEKYYTKDLIYLQNLLKVENAKPDLLFVPGHYFDVSKIVFQTRDLKIKAPFLGGAGRD